MGSEGSANTAQVEIEPAHVIARTSHTILFPGLGLARWTLGPLAVVRAKAATATLLALRPLAIVMAEKTATAPRAP